MATPQTGLEVRQGPIAAWDPLIDETRSRLTKALTPQRLISLIDSAEDGALGDWLELCEELIDKDTRISAVINTRRRALTGLPWAIKPNTNADDPAHAQATADWLDAYLSDRHRAREFARFLRHNATGLGIGLAVTEKVFMWGTDLREFLPVSSNRILADYSQGKQIRVLTKDDRGRGIPATADKFVVFMPHNDRGLPMKGAPMRPCALCWLGKNMALKDWMNFVERYGMPAPYASYDGSSDKDKKSVFTALQALASGHAAILPSSIEAKFAEIGDRANQPYESIAEFLNREITIAILGQHLTTDTTGGTGTLAAAAVHDRVRQDILDADIEAERTCIEYQVFAQLIEWEFGADAPVPEFRRSVTDVADALTVESQVRTAQAVKLPLSVSQLREKLDLREPSGPEDEVGADAAQGDVAAPSVGGQPLPAGIDDLLGLPSGAAALFADDASRPSKAGAGAPASTP